MCTRDRAWSVREVVVGAVRGFAGHRGSPAGNGPAVPALSSSSACSAARSSLRRSSDVPEKKSQ